MVIFFIIWKFFLQKKLEFYRKYLSETKKRQWRSSQSKIIRKISKEKREITSSLSCCRRLIHKTNIRIGQIEINKTMIF